MTFTRRLLFFAVLLTSLIALTGFLPASVGAAEPTSLKNVKLWLYPEYDDPRLLVVIDGEIEGVTAPATIRFLVPAAAEMYSAGSMDASGTYIPHAGAPGSPARQASAISGWDEITYEVVTNHFRIEYYHDVIQKTPVKSIDFVLRPLYPISNMTLMSQEPRKSRDYGMDPQCDSQQTVEGFVFHIWDFTDVPANTPLRQNIHYTRTETRPSLEINPSSGEMAWTIGIVGLVGAALTGGIVWILRRRPAPRKSRPVPAGRGASNRAQQRRGKEKATQRAAQNGGQGGGQGGAQASAGGKRFCAECGHRVDGPARFCPGCGNKL